MATVGILVGGGPAPGINGVIGSAAIYARSHGARVLGLREGFRFLMQGRTDRTVELDTDAVSLIHLQGGSILHTARANPTKNPGDLEKVVATLRELGVDHLVTIGGDDTCHSARCVAEAAGDALRVAHVPKTIDNDLPLPPGIPTFGFETARQTGATLVGNLMEDARTTRRWYIVVLMGRSAGFLAHGAAKAAGAPLALVREEFPDGHIRLADVARRIEATIVKRMAAGSPYGVAVVAEGIGELLHPDDLAQLPEIERDEHGHVRLAELPLGDLLAKQVGQGLAELGVKMAFVTKDIGYELRCATPTAYDVDYTRDLGAGAARCLLGGTHSVMITRDGSGIHPVPVAEVLDPETGRTRVRLLDVESESYQLARALQDRLEPTDLEDPALAGQIESITGRGIAELKTRWAAGLAG